MRRCLLFFQPVPSPRPSPTNQDGLRLPAQEYEEAGDSRKRKKHDDETTEEKAERKKQKKGEEGEVAASVAPDEKAVRVYRCRPLPSEGRIAGWRIISSRRVCTRSQRDGRAEEAPKKEKKETV